MAVYDISVYTGRANDMSDGFFTNYSAEILYIRFYIAYYTSQGERYLLKSGVSKNGKKFSYNEGDAFNSLFVFNENNNVVYSLFDRNGIQYENYIDEQGNFITKKVTDVFSHKIKVSDTPSSGGLSTLHIDDTRLEQINYGSKSYTSFPVDIPLDPNVKTMTVIGKTFNVQLDNELNIVRVKDGQTEYRQFPATIMVGENKTLQLYGKEDPEITIDYTGTQDPVISNTPATPPPVV